MAARRRPGSTPAPEQSHALIPMAAEPTRHAAAQHPPEEFLTAYIDGGARGNPGPAGYGVVLQARGGNVVAELSQYLGIRTNNYAEYSGLVAALEYALQHGFPALRVVSDSELMVKQMKGEYKV